MTPTRSQIEEALVWADEMAFDILNGYAHSAEAGVKLFRQIEAAARAVLSAPTDMMCLTHRSLWYDNEGQCQRAAAATAWKEDDTMWQDCTSPAPVALVPMEDGE